jgi:uncharacterized BrkB/YihY/UPF0761 family membrane protein
VIDLATLSPVKRAGWHALSVALTALLLAGMWVVLDLDPGIMTAAVSQANENQIGTWTAMVLLTAGGCWWVCSMVVRNLAAVLHAGYRLMWDVPFIVSGLTILAFLLTLAAPLSNALFQMLAAGTLLSAFAKWLDGVITEVRRRQEEA